MIDSAQIVLTLQREVIPYGRSYSLMVVKRITKKCQSPHEAIIKPQEWENPKLTNWIAKLGLKIKYTKPRQTEFNIYCSLRIAFCHFNHYLHYHNLINAFFSVLSALEVLDLTAWDLDLAPYVCNVYHTCYSSTITSKYIDFNNIK